VTPPTGDGRRARQGDGMEIRGIQRLERDVERMFEQLRRSMERQAQLSAALVKSREEVERLRSELQRFKSERTDTRKKVDALLREFENLDLRLDVVEG
jgi:septal ring factor EnvC (AmiA/AmiB activator)